MNNKLRIVFILIFIISGCSDNSIVSEQNFNLSNLYKEWIHAYDEETDSVQIYRPSDFKEFQASWFRQVYEFNSDNSCKYLVLSPTDAHYFEDGIWDYTSTNELLKIFDINGNIITEYKIVELNENLLKLVLIE
jgi:hypothetical protein